MARDPGIQRCAIVGVICAICLGTASAAPPRVSRPVWSPDNARLALADDAGNGVYVYDLDGQTLVRLTDAPSSGAWVDWSPDGRGLGFKILQPAAGDDFPAQMSAVYRVDSGTVEPLLPATRRAGVPSFSAGGRVAFTLENEVLIADAGGNVIEGDPRAPRKQRDVWTFARRMGQDDPNWQLVATA